MHAEWLWEGGGGVMFGSRRGGGIISNVGGSSANLVCGDPDDLFARAVAAGATALQDVVEQGYGGRGGNVVDPEGNHWSFGDYQFGAEQTSIGE